MKILLINPPALNTIPEQKDAHGKAYIESDDFGFFPPLGLLYILSYLEKNTVGHTLFFKDCVAEKTSYKKLHEFLLEIQPDIVGITSFTIALLDVIKTAQLIRSLFPNTHICLGGHHAIAFPLEAAQLQEFDSIIVGEGEVAFTELVKHLADKRDFTSIPGIYTKETIQKYLKYPVYDKRFLPSVRVPAAYIDNIDLLPPPNRTYIKHIKYHSIVGARAKLATIITSRGCPYTCTFCDVPYKQYRQRNVQLVIDEVESCLRMGYEEIHFYDDLFNITPERVIAICDEIDKRNLTFTWDFRGRVNTVTKESLARAKQSGCRMISFGIETGTDTGLALLKKGTNIQQIKQVFHWCQKLRIKTIADFMIGLPFEKSKEAILENIDFVIRLNPDYVQFAILTLFPNTKIYTQALNKGLVQKKQWSNFVRDPKPTFKLDHWEEFVSTAELVEIQKIAYKKFYLRPQYILKSIFSITGIFDLKNKVSGLLKILH